MRLGLGVLGVLVLLGGDEEIEDRVGIGGALAAVAGEEGEHARLAAGVGGGDGGVALGHGETNALVGGHGDGSVAGADPAPGFAAGRLVRGHGHVGRLGPDRVGGEGDASGEERECDGEGLDGKLHRFFFSFLFLVGRCWLAGQELKSGLSLCGRSGFGSLGEIQVWVGFRSEENNVLGRRGLSTHLNDFCSSPWCLFVKNDGVVRTRILPNPCAAFWMSWGDEPANCAIKRGKTNTSPPGFQIWGILDCRCQCVD